MLTKRGFLIKWFATSNTFTCLFKHLLALKVFSQWLHNSVTFWCTNSMWSFKCSFLLNEQLFHFDYVIFWYIVSGSFHFWMFCCIDQSTSILETSRKFLETSWKLLETSWNLLERKSRKGAGLPSEQACSCKSVHANLILTVGTWISPREPYSDGLNKTVRAGCSL